MWEVDFNVVGPISIEKEIAFRQEKGFDQHQFYSDINLRKSPFGIKATITAYAENINIAETVAYVYFGRMRDVLSLENDIPIQLYKHEGAFVSQKSFVSRRLLSKSDIISAFKMARQCIASVSKYCIVGVDNDDWRYMYPSPPPKEMKDYWLDEIVGELRKITSQEC